MPRDLYVVANWKMHKTARETTDYMDELIPKLGQIQAKIYLAVPYTSIAAAARFAKSSNLVIGAQNMNDAREGAFTGEIAGLMLKEAGAEFVILGHSERRRLFGESSEWIHKKVVRALQEGLQPLVCVGEDLAEREAGKMEEVLKEQISKSLRGIPEADAKGLILAYEPVWAIGTGKSATAKMAGDAHAFCRSCLEDIFGKKVAGFIPILYGGSVKPENAAELVAQKEIDGVLVGGASLDAETFIKIALNCENVK